MDAALCELIEGPGPIVAAAIHDGHAVREEVGARLAVCEADRLREEDPFTGRLAGVAPTRLIARRSRFEIDLNRARERAVYVKPEDAWGLRVWRDEPPADLIARSLAEYDAFYATARAVLERKQAVHGRFVVLDLHSYNHRRGGPEAPPAAPAANPEVNVGTGSMPPRWRPVADAFIEALRQPAALGQPEAPGRPLDVRENVKFRGGHFSRWIHAVFPECGCALAVEFKKTFMDEWTGAPDEARLAGLERALASTLPVIEEALERIAV